MAEADDLYQAYRTNPLILITNKANENCEAFSSPVILHLLLKIYFPPTLLNIFFLQNLILIIN